MVPELGFYASDDREVIAKQVSQMEEVGVTWIMTHWWGWLLGYLPGTPHRLDPFLKDGVYDKNWELVYKAMEEDENQVKLILIGTWNDYHEQSQIEPSYNGPLGSGHLLLDKTKHYWFRLKDGQPYEEYPKPWVVPIAPPDK